MVCDGYSWLSTWQHWNQLKLKLPVSQAGRDFLTFHVMLRHSLGLGWCVKEHIHFIASYPWTIPRIHRWQVPYDNHMFRPHLIWYVDLPYLNFSTSLGDVWGSEFTKVFKVILFLCKWGQARPVMPRVQSHLCFKFLPGLCVQGNNVFTLTIKTPWDLFWLRWVLPPTSLTTEILKSVPHEGKGAAEPLQSQLHFGFPGLSFGVPVPLLIAEGIEQQGNEEVKHLG